MIANVSMFAIFAKEIHDTRAQAREVVQIRVTPDAIAGSVTTTPIAPERLRLLAAQQREFPHHEGGLTADPQKQEAWREIVIHPADWRTLLTEPEVRPITFAGQGEPTAVFGIPVVHG